MDNYNEYKLLEQSKMAMVDQIVDRLLIKLHDLEFIIETGNGWIHLDGYMWPKISKRNQDLLKNYIDPLLFKGFRWLYNKGIENSFSFMYYNIMLKNEKWAKEERFGEVVLLTVFRLLEYYFDVSKCLELTKKENCDNQDIELLDFYKKKFIRCGLFHE